LPTPSAASTPWAYGPQEFRIRMKTKGAIVTTEVPTKAITSTQRIYDAVCELHALEQVVTRETVAELTGLKLTVVDDRLGALVDDEKIKRVLRGVYVPVEQHPPARAISKSVLPDGMVMIEIGDEVLHLTGAGPRAVRSCHPGRGHRVFPSDLHPGR
jgi:hypothetical protein